MAAALPKEQPLSVHLDLSACNLDDANAFELFCGTLELDSACEQIKITGACQSLNAASAAKFADALAVNCNVTALDVRGSALDFDAILAIVRSKSALRDFQFDDKVAVDEAQRKRLAQALAENKTLARSAVVPASDAVTAAAPEVAASAMTDNATLAVVEDANAGSATANASPQATPVDESPEAYVASLEPLTLNTKGNFAKTANYCFKEHAKTCAPIEKSRYLKRFTKELAYASDYAQVGTSHGLFISVDETNHRAIKALIIGSQGTPYENGCYEFDVMLQCGECVKCQQHNYTAYPMAPPKVQYKTTARGKWRANPNLYAEGKVCLSTLGTWDGPGWNPQSNWMQVLADIQASVLVDQPYFNEPNQHDDSEATQKAFNDEVRNGVMLYAIAGQLREPPPSFSDAVTKHFAHKRTSILAQCAKWSAEALPQEERVDHGNYGACGQLRAARGGHREAMAVALQWVEAAYSGEAQPEQYRAPPGADDYGEDYNEDDQYEQDEQYEDDAAAEDPELQAALAADLAVTNSGASTVQDAAAVPMVETPAAEAAASPTPTAVSEALAPEPLTLPLPVAVAPNSTPDSSLVAAEAPERPVPVAYQSTEPTSSPLALFAVVAPCLLDGQLLVMS